MRLLRNGSAGTALLFGANFVNAISTPAKGMNVEAGSDVDYSAACPDYAVYAKYPQ